MAPKKTAKPKTAQKSLLPVPKPRSKKPQPSSVRYVVGLGASAGGLEALQALFSTLKPTPDMCWVVAQHLAPQHRSRMVEILANSSQMPISELHDGAALVPGQIFITPPNCDVVLEEGLWLLKPPKAAIGPKPSINRFFTSLAKNLGNNAIGVVLSGTGSDGSIGIEDIKACGGMTLCQRLSTAKYDGMPRACQQTGKVDLELDPKEMAKYFFEISNVGKRRANQTEWLKSIKNGIKRDPEAQILDLLQQKTGVQFSLYKKTTLGRRIERRMAATHCGSLAEYYRFIEENKSEIEVLFQDILISVTSFFRDANLFQL